MKHTEDQNVFTVKKNMRTNLTNETHNKKSILNNLGIFSFTKFSSL